MTIDIDPREYCKIKYSAPPESCKCGNCQLVPVAQLVAWSDLIERMDESLHQIESWSRAYPLKVFPEPDFTKVRQILEDSESGITLDAVSASNMRHVIEGVGKIARQGLALTSGLGKS